MDLRFLRDSSNRLQEYNFKRLVVVVGHQADSVFPYGCNAIQSNGCFSIILLNEDYNHLEHLEKSSIELVMKKPDERIH